MVAQLQVEHREYDSFGALDAAYNSLGNPVAASNLCSTVGYTGKFFDATTGLQYNNARWYDPGTGQFITTDFGGFIDGPNLYWYAKNNPILLYDPSGNTAKGHPLSNLYGSFDAYGGGYSGGKVGAAPSPAFAGVEKGDRSILVIWTCPLFSLKQGDCHDGECNRKRDSGR